MNDPRTIKNTPFSEKMAYIAVMLKQFGKEEEKSVNILIVREEVLGCMVKSIMGLDREKVIKRELNIQFLGEDGIDEGGLS